MEAGRPQPLPQAHQAETVTTLKVTFLLPKPARRWLWKFLFNGNAVWIKPMFIKYLIDMQQMIVIINLRNIY